MITDFFETTEALRRLRAGCTGVHVDGFARRLDEIGYARNTVRDYLRAAAHLGRFADRHDLEMSAWGRATLKRFQRHLGQCHCVRRNKGEFDNDLRGAEHFLAYLRTCGLVGPDEAEGNASRFAPISQAFAAWMIRHKGVMPSTTHRYQLALAPFLERLGSAPSRYTVKKIRSFVVSRHRHVGRGELRSSVTAIRGFLRFLVAEGRVASGLQHCVPTVPQWRLSALPRYLEAPAVKRVIDSCDLSTGIGLRDHAILLLLARLGLRAGDIVAASLDDFDWRRGTLRVKGKGRREVLLPLPQEVGDAVFAYLRDGRPTSECERVFLTVRAPTRPFSSSAAVSEIVQCALTRAGIADAPSRGAHVLRHSAATAMLRSGASLETIGSVLRHQSPETTALYAKVDLEMLREVAQPWPGGTSC